MAGNPNDSGTGIPFAAEGVTHTGPAPAAQPPAETSSFPDIGLLDDASGDRPAKPPQRNVITHSKSGIAHTPTHAAATPEAERSRLPTAGAGMESPFKPKPVKAAPKLPLPKQSGADRLLDMLQYQTREVNITVTAQPGDDEGNNATYRIIAPAEAAIASHMAAMGVKPSPSSFESQSFAIPEKEFLSAIEQDGQSIATLKVLLAALTLKAEAAEKLSDREAREQALAQLKKTAINAKASEKVQQTPVEGTLIDRIGFDTANVSLERSKGQWIFVIDNIAPEKTVADLVQNEDEQALVNVRGHGLESFTVPQKITDLAVAGLKEATQNATSQITI